MSTVLSVVVPVARMAGKLTKFSNFLKSLTPGEVEVIVILDIYDSATTSELMGILSKLPLLKIKFCEDQFGSPGAARNAGLELATSDWVWFCDADDEPNISTVLKTLRNVPADYEILIFNYSKVDENSGTEILYLGSHDLISICLNPGLWRMVMRRDFIQLHKFENYSLGEDQLFLLKIGIFHCESLFVNENVYKYSFGGDGHLVDRRDKVHDLYEVFVTTFSEINRVGKAESKYVSLLALRQLLTIFKIGSSKMKILTFIHLCRTLFRKPTNILQLLFTTPTFLKRQFSL